GATGKLDLSVISQLVKLENGTKLEGLLDAGLDAKGNLSALEKKQYDQFKAAGHLALKQFRYQSNAYPDGILLSNLLMTFNPSNVTLNDLTGEYLKTKFNAHGTVNNLLAYALKNKTLDGSLQIKADEMDLNKWMGISTDTTSSSTTSSSSAPFVVPSNLQFVVKVDVDKVHYNKLDMQQVGGTLAIADESVKLTNVHGNALDGTIVMNGSYSTKEDKKKPAIDFSYDVKNLSIQKTFLAFNTVEKMMPIGRYMDGKISSQLKMSGHLGEQMNPDLNTLNGDGSLLIPEGVIKKFEPLDKLTETLHLDPLKDVAIKDVKTAFSFKNGRVIVNPFKLKVKDIQMEIGGSHGFDQTLDYAMSLQVPRSMMGSQANAMVNSLVTQVSNKGVPIKVSDVIHVNVKMGGTIANPVIKPDWKDGVSNTASNIKQQANDFVKSQVDSAKLLLKDTVQSVKNQLSKDAMSELKKQLSNDKDSTAVAGSGGLDDSKKKAEDAGKGLINSLLKKKK
ncbi:MAG TPA: AsmA-like C-terminal region-containing protein, partial [Puia sp.]|nr:AsmA-like C-terminal region-containing protein [Puia sp.]